MAATVDAVIITALKEELDALLKVETGFVEPWRSEPGGNIPYHLATLDGRHGPVRVAAARLTQMGGAATAGAATRLADSLAPGCLAMCGVCAGHPEDTDLGDVIIADRVFHHDQGKQKRDAFEGDLWVHSLSPRWLRTAQDMEGPAKGFHGYGVPSDDARRWWFIEHLLAGRDPLRSAAFRRYLPDSRRAAILETLRDQLGHIAFSGETFALTDAGRHAGLEHRVVHGTLATKRPYHIHVGPMGSGNAVIADGLIWNRLATSRGMRKTLAVEMEGASVGQVAHERSLPFMVVKGVMDHADQHKDDRFKAFAARVSAEVLLDLLRRVEMASVRLGHGPTIDNRGATIGQQIVVEGNASFGATTLLMNGAQPQQPPATAPPSTEDDLGEIDEERLVDELARVLWDPDRARAVAIAAGFEPGNIPVMKTPRGFWSQLVEDAHNGAVRGAVKAVASAAARVFANNAIFEGYEKP